MTSRLVRLVQESLITRSGGMAYPRHIDRREPWQMTLKEFQTPATPTPRQGYMIVYHRIKRAKDLEGILHHGLLKTHAGGETGVRGDADRLWGTSDPDDYSSMGILLTLQVPKNQLEGPPARLSWFSDVPPSDILAVDMPAYSSVSNMGLRISTERKGDYSKEYHRAYVYDALEKGKAVPARVLRDYPELQKRSRLT